MFLIVYENFCFDEISYCYKFNFVICIEKSYLSWLRMNCRKFCNFCVGKLFLEILIIYLLLDYGNEVICFIILFDINSKFKVLLIIYLLF